MSAGDTQLTATYDGMDPADVDAFIGRWEKSGGAEMANFQPFANELCALLNVPQPEPSQELNEWHCQTNWTGV